uniref:Uncharacterized protein n=1 Tax=Herelleviridae sp. ct7M529 TaxID=2826787 RepID=A0A8S5LW57_9CAUD|nr:MAG TPA: hypothetical protein [Herelleviridae sp. ct7M529]
MATNVINGNMTTLYYLLWARYASNHIRSDYPQQWKMKIMMTVFEYGPTWSKRLEIQDKMRSLSDDEIQKGTIMTYNTAMNPDGAPTTETWETLKGINSQNKNLYQRGKLDSYAYIDQILKTDVTREFVEKFKNFFDIMASPGEKLEYDLSKIAQLQSMDLQYVSGNPNEPLFGSYLTATFEEMFPSVSDWLDFYRTCGIPTTIPEV